MIIGFSWLLDCHEGGGVWFVSEVTNLAR